MSETEELDMRDIRADLRERLDAVAKDRATLQSQLAELNGIETGIRALLQREGTNFTATSTNGNGSSGKRSAATGTELSQFLSQTMSETGKPLPLAALRDRAVQAGIDFGAKKPGRVVHWALVGMQQHGSVEKQEDKWIIKDGADAIEVED